MKKLDWLILILLLLSPILVKYIIVEQILDSLSNDSMDGWLGFYGALLGSLITMFVLYRTRRWNRDDNDETRLMQAKVLEYQAKRVWFENFRKQLDDNYRILNFQDAIIAVNDISSGNCQRCVKQIAHSGKLLSYVLKGLMIQA